MRNWIPVGVSVSGRSIIIVTSTPKNSNFPSFEYIVELLNIKINGPEEDRRGREYRRCSQKLPKLVARIFTLAETRFLMLPSFTALNFARSACSVTGIVPASSNNGCAVQTSLIFFKI